MKLFSNSPVPAALAPIPPFPLIPSFPHKHPQTYTRTVHNSHRSPKLPNVTQISARPNHTSTQISARPNHTAQTYTIPRQCSVTGRYIIPPLKMDSSSNPVHYSRKGLPQTCLRLLPHHGRHPRYHRYPRQGYQRYQRYQRYRLPFQPTWHGPNGPCQKASQAYLELGADRDRKRARDLISAPGGFGGLKTSDSDCVSDLTFDGSTGHCCPASGPLSPLSVP